jgi:hypothetical protein
MSEMVRRLSVQRLTSKPVDLPSMDSLVSAPALLEEGSDDDGDDSSDSVSSITSRDCDEALTSPVTPQYSHSDSVSHSYTAYVPSRRRVLFGDL